MSAGNLLFFEVTFQKGRRREGGEDSWRVNQGMAVLMVMAGRVTGTVLMVIHQEVSHRSQLSRATQGHMPPQGRTGRCDYCCLTERKRKTAEWRVPCSSLCQINASAGLDPGLLARNHTWAPAVASRREWGLCRSQGSGTCLLQPWREA